ncbi:IS3 family transposase [Acidiphilium sp. PA]|uniref:IS3 family transposase n=1 Tax=Acidiphilium sp. PA TaxID=2871705 RepID=UPI0038D24F77
MITPNAELSINRQCALLGVARSSFYHRPRAESAEEIDLLARLDGIFTAHPVYGSRRLQVALGREGISVGRRRIRRLMKKLGLCAVRPKPNTSKPNHEHMSGTPPSRKGKTGTRRSSHAVMSTACSMRGRATLAMMKSAS